MTDLPPTPVDLRPPSRRSASILYVLMLLALLLSRGLTATPQADVPVRNMDEQLMFAVGVSSITGGPANTIGWPGGSMRVATTLLVPAVFAIEHVGTILHHRREVPAEFVRFLGHELRDPWRMVALLRATSIVLSSLGFACLPLVLRRSTASNAIAFAVALIALSAGTIWTRSLMATGDAVGWATAVVGIWASLRSRESVRHAARWTIVAALCAGLATASKLTSIYLWPIIFLASIDTRRAAISTFAIWLIAVPLGHYLLNPYVVTDPLRVAKAVAGNVLTRGVNTPLIDALTGGMPIVLVFIAALSLPLAVTRRNAWLLVATIGTLAMYAITIRRAAMIEPHYLAPFTIPLTLLATLGVDWLKRRSILARHPSIVCGTLAIAVAVSLVLGFRATRQASVAAAAKYGVGEAAVRYLESIDFHGRIGVQPSQSYHDLFLARIESDDSITARITRIEAQLAGGRSVVAALTKTGIDPIVAVGLADAFNDSDRMKLANYRSMSVAGVARGPFVVQIQVPESTTVDRSALAISPTEAVERFKRGELDALLVASPIDGLSDASDFGGAPGAQSLLYLRSPTTASPATTASAGSAAPATTSHAEGAAR